LELWPEVRGKKGKIMIITKDLSKGDIKISEHFKLSEFKCPGTNIVKYDTEIVEMLEKIRRHFGGSVTITSGYRTLTYNNKVGGAKNSAHLDGKAADFKVENAQGEPVGSKYVCLFLDEIGWPKQGGIGYINTATHFDTKFVGSRIDETRPGTTTRYKVVTTSYATYFGYAVRTVIVPKLNIRTSPSATAPLAGSKLLGQKVRVYKTATDSKGRTWIKISFIFPRWVARWLTK